MIEMVFLRIASRIYHNFKTILCGSKKEQDIELWDKNDIGTTLVYMPPFILDLELHDILGKLVQDTLEEVGIDSANEGVTILYEKIIPKAIGEIVATNFDSAKEIVSQVTATFIEKLFSNRRI